MKRTIAAIALSAAAVLVLGGCSSSDDGPSEDELRATACESFASITPGFYESSDAVSTLSDPGASTSDRVDALRAQLDQSSSSNKRTRPYDCNDARDAKWFDDFYASVVAEQRDGK
ncbi:hypothetical protein [Rhodococcus sp. BE178]|uniref:hypothetical protein n=1 Tax=Rhodococcus sp. BE178 TaxID=2817737 RepID=UPI003D23BE13